MSLTNRLSLFFLAALAVVLAGFSLTLYALAHRHLHARANHRLDSAMQTLVAAIEVHPGDVEWEPLERHITMGEDPDPEQLRWLIHDVNGRLIDCSRNLEHSTEGTSSPANSDWRIVVRRLRAGSFRHEPLDERPMPFVGSLSDGFSKGQNPADVTLPQDRTFHGDELILTVAVAEGPVAATLQQLAISMTLISLVVWLFAAVCGRWLCRRALSPVIRMATSARAIRRRATAGVFLDIGRTRDELEDLGVAFNELLADLRESLESQRRFTGDASHQLRTPLAAMLTSVEVALRQERPAAEYRKVLDVVRRRGGQLRQVIESLLFLARPEADSRPPELVLVDLSDFCHDRVSAWEEHERAVDIHLDMPSIPVVVRTHPALLGQVLDNLIDNALKYSESGSSVTVTVKAKQETISLIVADEGCGIPADELPHIFEPFYRATAARWQGKPGVGLGLTVAYRLVGILGGKLDVNSESGKGSSFRIDMPVGDMSSGYGDYTEATAMRQDGIVERI